MPLYTIMKLKLFLYKCCTDIISYSFKQVENDEHKHSDTKQYHNLVNLLVYVIPSRIRLPRWEYNKCKRSLQPVQNNNGVSATCKWFRNRFDCNGFAQSFGVSDSAISRYRSRRLRHFWLKVIFISRIPHYHIVHTHLYSPVSAENSK